MSDLDVTEETTSPPVLSTASAEPTTNSLEDDDQPKPKPSPPIQQNSVQETVPGFTNMVNQWEIRGIPEEQTFFSNDSGLMAAALEAIKARLDEQDSNIRGYWLLAEVDHWDLEKERIVVLTDKNLIAIKYNFVQQLVDELRYIPLAYIRDIQVGSFTYTHSYAHVRQAIGMKVIWGDINIGFFKKWNPFSTAVPFTTFTSHVLVIRKKTSDPKMKIDGVPEMIERAINDLRVRSAEAQAANTQQPVATPPEFKIRNEAIVVDYYLGVSAMVHNQSYLGFSKKRGAVNW